MVKKCHFHENYSNGFIAFWKRALQLFLGRFFPPHICSQKQVFPATAERSPWPLISSGWSRERPAMWPVIFMEWFNTRQPCWKLVKGVLELHSGIERPLSPAALLDGSVSGAVLFDKSVAVVKVPALQMTYGFEGLEKWSVRVSLTHFFFLDTPGCDSLECWWEVWSKARRNQCRRCRQ